MCGAAWSNSQQNAHFESQHLIGIVHLLSAIYSSDFTSDAAEKLQKAFCSFPRRSQEKFFSVSMLSALN